GGRGILRPSSETVWRHTQFSRCGGGPPRCAIPHRGSWVPIFGPGSGSSFIEIGPHILAPSHPPAVIPTKVGTSFLDVEVGAPGWSHARSTCQPIVCVPSPPRWPRGKSCRFPRIANRHLPV